jgi:hypothetical protein
VAFAHRDTARIVPVPPLFETTEINVIAGGHVWIPTRCPKAVDSKRATPCEIVRNGFIQRWVYDQPLPFLAKLQKFHCKSCAPCDFSLLAPEIQVRLPDMRSLCSWLLQQNDIPAEVLIEPAVFGVASGVSKTRPLIFTRKFYSFIVASIINNANMSKLVAQINAVWKAQLSLHQQQRAEIAANCHYLNALPATPDDAKFTSFVNNGESNLEVSHLRVSL